MLLILWIIIHLIWKRLRDTQWFLTETQNRRLFWNVIHVTNMDIISFTVQKNHVGESSRWCQESFTFSGAVDGAVVSSFGHLQHPSPQQVFIGAVGWCVTPRALDQKQEKAQKSTTKLHLPTQHNFCPPKTQKSAVSRCDQNIWFLTEKQL